MPSYIECYVRAGEGGLSGREMRVKAGGKLRFYYISFSNPLTFKKIFFAPAAYGGSQARG